MSTDESLNNSLAVVSDRRIEPVASTKLLPPRPSRRLVPRDALQARLLEARRQRCVVVQGPAGSGKTSTLVVWRQALLALDFDVAWLSISAEDSEPTRFFDCLLASIGEIDPEAVREAALVMGRDSDESALEHAVITVVQAISSRPRELVLMFDDVQHLEDARIFQALQWLLDYAPPKLHLTFASRNALPLSFTRLRSQGLVSEFDLRDLRFTFEETERFLREQLGSIAQRDAQVLHELTDGWVAGLQLFAVDLKAKRSVAFARVQVRDPQAFASYFEREVLGHLVPDDLALLTRAAGCNRFCASLCATLTGQPHEVARMASRLAHLDRENLFISQVRSHDRESWYRVHPLLREVLLTHLAALPDPERHALHGMAWRWFDAHGHIDEAVRHAVQAGDVQAAADLVESIASGLLSRGALSQLASLMHRLPAEQVRQRIGLRLLMANMQLYARNLDALTRSLQEMEAGCEALDARQRYGLTLLRGGLALQRDDTNAVLAIQAELEAIPDDADAYAFASRGHVLAWMHMNCGDYTRARAVLADSAARGAGVGRLLVGRSLEGMSYSLEGRMTEAEHRLCEALQAAESDPSVDVGVACVAAGLLSDALYESNELEAAVRLIEPRIDLLERSSIPDAVLRALLVLAHAHWLGGRPLEGLATLERLEDYASRQHLDRLLSHALLLRLRWHLRQGESRLAEDVMARMAELSDRHAGGGLGTAAEIRGNARRARVEWCLHWNDFGAALVLLRPAVARADAAGRGRRAASLHLQIALAERGLGNAEAAQQHLVQALRLGHGLGLMRCLLDLSPAAPGMLEAALAEAALDPVLGFYAQRLLAATVPTQQRANPHPLGGDGSALDSISEREREVLALVAQAMPNKKIARVLGVTPHTVKWHLRKIYSKLGVAERDEAVARMRDMESREAPRVPVS